MMRLRRADQVSRLEKGTVGYPSLDISGDGKIDSRQPIIPFFYAGRTDHGLGENRGN